MRFPAPLLCEPRLKSKDWVYTGVVSNRTAKVLVLGIGAFSRVLMQMLSLDTDTGISATLTRLVLNPYPDIGFYP